MRLGVASVCPMPVEGFPPLPAHGADQTLGGVSRAQSTVRRRVSAAIGSAGLPAALFAGERLGRACGLGPRAERSQCGRGGAVSASWRCRFPVSDPAICNGLAAVAVGLFTPAVRNVPGPPASPASTPTRPAGRWECSRRRTSTRTAFASPPAPGSGMSTSTSSALVRRPATATVPSPSIRRGAARWSRR